MSRKLLAATVVLFAITEAAGAADLPSRAPPPDFVPPPPPLMFTWTGVYVGLEVGGQFGTSSVNDSFTGAQTSFHPGGIVGGGYAGYNYQINQIVFGLEGDVDGSSYHGSGFDMVTGATHSTREPVEGSVRGRLGFAWDRVLIYGTGGVAFASVRDDTSFGVPPNDTFNNGRVGWTVGGGAEYAFGPNWSVRAEYRYTDLGHVNEFEANTTGDSVTKHETDNKVLVGISYRFGAPPPAPVIAKY